MKTKKQTDAMWAAFLIIVYICIIGSIALWVDPIIALGIVLASIWAVCGFLTIKKICPLDEVSFAGIAFVTTLWPLIWILVSIYMLSLLFIYDSWEDLPELPKK